MIYSYCKRCKIESPGEFCQQCGKRLSPQSQRNLWSVSARPLADGRIWRGAALALVQKGGRGHGAHPRRGKRAWCKIWGVVHPPPPRNIARRPTLFESA